MCLPQTEAIRSNDVFHKSVSRVGSHRSIQAPTVIFEARGSLNDVHGCHHGETSRRALLLPQAPAPTGNGHAQHRVSYPLGVFQS